MSYISSQLKITEIPINSSEDILRDRFHSRVRIEGPDFLIELFLDTIECSRAWFSNKTIKATLDLSCIATLDLQQLRRAFSILRININPDRKLIRISSEEHLVFDISNTRDLAKVLATKDPKEELWLQSLIANINFNREYHEDNPGALSRLGEIADIIKFYPKGMRMNLTAFFPPETWQEEDFLKSFTKRVKQIKSSDENFYISNPGIRNPRINPDGIDDLLIKNLSEMILQNKNDLAKISLKLLTELIEMQTAFSKSYLEFQKKSLTDRKNQLGQISSSDDLILDLIQYNYFLYHFALGKIKSNDDYILLLQQIDQGAQASTFEELCTALETARTYFLKVISNSPEQNPESTQCQPWMSSFFVFRKVIERDPTILLTFDLTSENLKKLGFDGFPISSIIGEWLLDIARDLFNSEVLECSKQAWAIIENLKNETVFSKQVSDQAREFVAEMPTPSSTILFDDSFRWSVSWDWCVRRVLQADPVIQRELSNYTEVYVTQDDLITPIKLTDLIDVFLENDEQGVLLIKGGSGSGKTFFSKKLAWEQKHYTSSIVNKYDVIYSPLDKLESFEYRIHLRTESMKLYSIATLSPLRERKILWIFDNYDKINVGERGFPNLYITNEFRDSPNSKVIFLCNDSLSKKKEFYSEVFSPDFGRKLMQAQMIPFKKE